MMTLWQDMRYGARALRRSPGYSAVAVIVLALGIAANSTVFTIANEVYLRPMPLARQPDRLVAVCFAGDNQACGKFTHPEYLDLRDGSHTLSGVIAWRTTDLNLSGPGTAAARVMGATVSGNYFTVLGVHPALGRWFLPEEDRTPGTHPVAILSYALWNRRFAGDRGIFGRPITLNGTAFTVVGIAPEGFKGVDLFERIDVWIPVMMEEQAHTFLGSLNNRRFDVLHVAGRLADGIGLTQAQAEMDVLGRRIAQAAEDASRQRKHIRIYPGIRLSPDDRGEAAAFIALLTGVAAFVLLIACANVANLALARASSRRREIAVQLAMGATRWRLVRQLLTEGLLLAVPAGLAGLLLCLWTSRLLNLFDWGADLNFSPDYRVAAFTVFVTALAALLFGAGPAARATGAELVPALKDASVSGGAERSKTRRLLVVAQMALSVALLTGAVLCLRTYVDLRATSPGFDLRNTLQLRVDLRTQGYSKARSLLFYRQLMARAASIPGVESVAVAATAPFGWTWTADVIIEGSDPSRDGPYVTVDSNTVTPGYFQMLRIPIVRGRGFNAGDKAGGAPVCLVSEAMANRFWRGQDPTTKYLRLKQFFGPGPFLRVAGVVKDIHQRNLAEAPRPLIYLPFEQAYDTNMTLLARAVGEPAGVVASLRKEMTALDRDLPVPEITSLRQRMDDSTIGERENAILMGSFGLLAVTLAATGLYAVMSYSVARRTHEIGIRMALGAGKGDVLKMVAGEAMRLALVGSLAGMAGALALTRVLRSALYRLSPADPLTFAAVAALLCVVVLVACYVPARRAMRVDPATALRHE